MVFIVDTTDWGIEIDAEIQQQAWQHSQQQETPWSRWNTYLNLCCLEQILQWLQLGDFPQAQASQSLDRNVSQWRQINGFAIDLEAVRLVFLPSEAIDQTELIVPEIWANRPDWIGDYYINVQFSADGTGLRLVGYTTHKQLKQYGELDPTDRTYSLDYDDLTLDFNLLWLTYSHYTAAQTRAKVQPIMQLVSESNPRSLTRLGNWLQGQIEAVWQTLEDGLDIAVAPNFIPIPVRSMTRIFLEDSALISRIKELSFPKGNLGLIVEVCRINEIESNERQDLMPYLTAVHIQLKILPILNSTALFGTIQVRLLSDDQTELDRTQSSRNEMIHLQFQAEVGEQFSVEISCDSEIQVEVFSV